MRTVGLVSGGKDSCYNMLQCIAAGHEIVALANLCPPVFYDESNTQQLDEIDSYMYQTVGHDAIALYSEAMGLPLYREIIQGTSVNQGADYTPSGDDDEVEDLYKLLLKIKETEAIEAVSVGAILSNYQRVRVENVCSRLGLASLSYLWQRDQEELLEEMINCGVEAILIKVAALGLDPKKHLGKTLRDCQTELRQLKNKFGLNVCGEGGEYETLTLNCPLFKKAILIEEMKIIPHSMDPFAPVAYLKFSKLSLAEKESNFESGCNQIRGPEDFCRDELAIISSCEELGSKSTEFKGRLSKIDVPSEQVSFRGTTRTQSGLIFISGLFAETETDFAKMMDSLQEIMENCGTNMNTILSICLYLKNMLDYPRINNIYKQYFGINPPVRVCVEVPLSCYSTIEVVAALPSIEKRTLHVQSISHWAPANIGPYSQCVEVNNIFMVSGQIGLIPGSMTLPQNGVFSECRLALRHVVRVLHAMDKTVSLKHALQVICFVTDEKCITGVEAIWNEYGGNKDHPIVFVITGNLPRNASIEWQISAHRSEASHSKITLTTPLSKKFGYMCLTRCEETTAFVCELERLPNDPNQWKALYESIILQIGENCALKIFYSLDADYSCWQALRDVIPESVAISFVPVYGFKSGLVASICGINSC